MKKSQKHLIKALAAIFLLLLFFISAPFLLKHQLVLSIEEACRRCTLKISSATFNPLTKFFSLGLIEFSYLEKSSMELKADIENIQGEFSYMDLIRGRLNIHALVLDKPKVVLTNMYFSDKQETSSPAKKESFKFMLPEVKVKDGSFSYIHKTKTSVARLNTSQISGHMEGLGNTDEYLEKSATCRLNGRVEKSGAVVLSVRSKVFKRPLEVDVDLKVKDQKLADLNTFFFDFEGFKLKGQLLEGHGQSHLRDIKIKTEVFARFENFDAEFSKTAERGPGGTFIMNLAKAIMYDSQNLDKSKRKQAKVVELQQEPNEALVGFILRSLKDAALKVAEN